MNLRQKHYALLKLAQVKKAMRFVLTKRAMKKQAADNPPVQYSPDLKKLLNSLPSYGGVQEPTDPLDNLPDFDPSNYWNVQNPDGKLNYWEPWSAEEGNKAIRDLFHQQTGTKAKTLFKGKNFATPLTLGDTGVPVGMDASLLPDDTGAILGGLDKYFAPLDAVLNDHRGENTSFSPWKPREGASPVDWNRSLYPDTPHPRLPEYGFNSLGLEGYDADNAALNSTAYNWAGNPVGDISENLPAVDNVKSIPSRFSPGGLRSALIRSQRLLSNYDGDRDDATYRQPPTSPEDFMTQLSGAGAGLQAARKLIRENVKRQPERYSTDPQYKPSWFMSDDDFRSKQNKRYIDMADSIKEYQRAQGIENARRDAMPKTPVTEKPVSGLPTPPATPSMFRD